MGGLHAPHMTAAEFEQKDSSSGEQSLRSAAAASQGPTSQTVKGSKEGNKQMAAHAHLGQVCIWWCRLDAGAGAGPCLCVSCCGSLKRQIVCADRHRVVRASFSRFLSNVTRKTANFRAQMQARPSLHHSAKMLLDSTRQQTRASIGRCWPMHPAPSGRRILPSPRHSATRLHASRPCRAAAAAQRPARRSHSVVVPKAYLHSDPSADSSGGSGSLPGQLKVLVVGANAAGLAAAVALAQAGCAVEVHDSRPDPRVDQNAHDSSSSSTLVALGKSGVVHSGAHGVSHAAAGQASAMVTPPGI